MDASVPYTRIEETNTSSFSPFAGVPMRGRRFNAANLLAVAVTAAGLSAILASTWIRHEVGIKMQGALFSSRQFTEMDNSAPVDKSFFSSVRIGNRERPTSLFSRQASTSPFRQFSPGSPHEMSRTISSQGAYDLASSQDIAIHASSLTVDECVASCGNQECREKVGPIICFMKCTVKRCKADRGCVQQCGADCPPGIWGCDVDDCIADKCMPH